MPCIFTSFRSKEQTLDDWMIRREGGAAFQPLPHTLIPLLKWRFVIKSLMSISVERCKERIDFARSSCPMSPRQAGSWAAGPTESWKSWKWTVCCVQERRSTTLSSTPRTRAPSAWWTGTTASVASSPSCATPTLSSFWASASYPTPSSPCW